VLDEKLDDVQKLLHLLKNGTKVQKKTALTLMPSVFVDRKEDASKAIIPFLNVCSVMLMVMSMLKLACS
jgi:hypothetical protein